MESLRRTSLFLFLTIVISLSLRAQTQADSLSYYYQIIIDQKDADKMVAAISFYEKQVAVHEANHDKMAGVQGLRLIANAQYHLGYLFECEASSTKALALLEQLPSTETTKEAEKALYSNLGRIYRTLSNTSTSIYYYDKALALATTARDSIININNKANVHADANEYRLAETELSLVYQLTLKQEDILTIAKAQDNLGFVQSKLGKPQGLINMNEALTLRLAQTDLTGIYSSYRHLAEYYMDRNQFEVAHEYAQKAYETAKTLNTATYLENALTNLLKTKNDPTFNHYLSLTDSLSRAKLAQENKYAGIKFNFEKEQRRANANALEKEKQKQSKILYQALGGAVLLTGVYLFFLLRARHKKEKLQQVYDTETRISKKVHDEVANDLYHVMIQLQHPDIPHEQLLDRLDKVYQKTRDISRESSLLDLEGDYTEVLRDLLLSYQSETVRIVTRNLSAVDWDSLSAMKKTMLYRVLQELMINMKKHSNATAVALVCTQTRNHIRIVYSDNGVGVALQKKSGLANTETRMESIGGSITFETAPQKGFKALLTV